VSSKANFRGNNLFIARKFNDEWRGNHRKDARKALCRQVLREKERKRKMNVSIRPWRITDAADLAAALHNKKVQDNLRDGLPYPYAPADAEDYIGAMLNIGPGAAYPFAIALDDRAVGSISAFRQENIHRRTAEIGYYVAEEHWGKGVCGEAVRQICRYLFKNTDIIRVFAEPFAQNAASRRVLEKAGFVREGTLTANAVKNGRILDMEMYALIRNSQAPV
jgi:RimJ/RimL family protein N-acetyltransferase